MKNDKSNYVCIKKNDTIVVAYKDKLVISINNDEKIYAGKGLTDSLLNYHNQQIQKYFNKIDSVKKVRANEGLEFSRDK